MKAWFLLPIFLSACGFNRSGVDDDASGDDAGATDATFADAAACIGNYPACRPDNTVIEDCVGGFVEAVMTCPPHTCIGAAGNAACGTVMPSNGIDISAVADAGAMIVSGTEVWAVRTGDGLITRCGATAGQDVTIRQATSLDNGIRYKSATPSSPATLGFESLVVANGAEVRFYGSDAIALVTATSMQIDGQLTISGGGLACTSSIERVCGRVTAISERLCGGSGGFSGGSVATNGFGPGGGQAIAAPQIGDFEFGGGGGGFGATGGQGGPDGANSGAPGGVVYGNPDLVPLEGGSGGAGGGLRTGTAGFGGGGGGAIQLTSFETLLISASGRIKATGAGGGRGGSAGAGGGGAGGAILLEAPSIQMIAGARLTANGGGGGGGDSGLATAGADGNFGSAQASGGTADPHAGGTGGSLVNMSGNDGQQDNNGGDGTGGGGGAAGRIHFRSSVGGFVITATDISPQEGPRGTDLVQP